MDIKIQRLVEGAKSSKGLVVIIDVLRACTTIPILLKQGAKEIIPVSSIEKAATYKQKGYILIGEAEHGHSHEVFDYNNSPSEISDKDFKNKKIVLRSNNATQAILSAKDADDIVLSSFVNVKAVVDYIKNRRLKVVTLLTSGRLGQKSIEDDLCAQVIKNELEGKSYNFDEIKQKIYHSPTAILVQQTLHRPKDVDIALMLNAYNILPRVHTRAGRKVIKA